MKLLGTVLVLCAGFLFSEQLNRTGRMRQRAALEMAQALDYIAGETEFALRPVPEILKHRGIGIYADTFFEAVTARETADPDRGLCLHWKEAAALLPLETAERETVIRLQTVWSGDETQMRQALYRASGSLRAFAERVGASQHERERLMRILTFSVSTFILIILI